MKRLTNDRIFHTHEERRYLEDVILMQSEVITALLAIPKTASVHVHRQRAAESTY